MREKIVVFRILVHTSHWPESGYIFFSFFPVVHFMSEKGCKYMTFKNIKPLEIKQKALNHFHVSGLVKTSVLLT